MTTQTLFDSDRLNADCACVTLDRDALQRAAETAVGDPAFARDLATTHPHLLSAQPMFLSAAHATRMREIITAIETIVKLPAYQTAVLRHAPDIARFDPGTSGVFMGYDFHLSPDGPKLIEINTNAGGALINAYLLEAQRACCAEMSRAVSRFGLRDLLAQFVSSFEQEWRRQGRSEPLRSIAIVDQAPTHQYLYPEFVLFQRLFAAHGLTAVIAAPEELTHRDGALWCGGTRIDTVYNRLTDFCLGLPHSSALRDAYLAGHAVVTPSPRAHALFANKRNLAVLTDEAILRTWGASEGTVSTLAGGIPKTLPLTSQNAGECWQRRSQLFFKPSAGFGAKAAYRGDKITRKVWADILSASYVAQEIVPPSTRTVTVNGALQSLKADLRNYTYDGAVQLIAARLYQGQTTNFRTPGGGFAPVFVADKAIDRLCC
jgi:hypothetical protein